jgi:hypothetical protein
VLPSGKKLSFGLRVYAYALFQAILPFFKSILEVMFFEGIQHHLQFCLDRLNCVILAFQFYLRLEKERKVGWVGATVMLS